MNDIFFFVFYTTNKFFFFFFFFSGKNRKSLWEPNNFFGYSTAYFHLSSHPDNIKRSIVYSQTLRASRLCSFKEDFADHSEKMKTWFSKRGYPDKIIENEMKKVLFVRAEVKPSLPQECLSLFHITPDSRP